MKNHRILTAVIIVGFLISFLSMSTGCKSNSSTSVTPEPQGPVKYSVGRAGLRASPYGPTPPFPSSGYWVDSCRSMSSRFNGAAPAVIWILGVMAADGGEFSGSCRLNFPAPDDGNTYPDILFNDTDETEEYLKHFDREGVKVWLQVEPANADISTLIDLVLGRYGSHPCVIGFGVDVEWFRWSTFNKEGVAVTDDEAQSWCEKVRSYNPDFLLFFKHWLISKMPPTYRKGLVFVDDSQQFQSMTLMVLEFQQWGRAFEPAGVAFQYGYPKDRIWWGNLQDPPRDIGNEILKKVGNTTGLFWVDFTMEEIWPR